MSYRFRNILFFSFVGIFVILTTIFSLYASGYRLSWDSVLRGQLPVQKTGILVLDSNPKGAIISLERQFRGLFFDANVLKNKVIKTPYKVKNLLPGEYILRIESDAYWPFEQKINIHPGQSTYLEDIVLFKKNLPVLSHASSLQNISIDPSFQKILLESDKVLLDLKDEKDIKLMNDVKTAEFIGDKKIILNKNIIFDYNKKKYLDWPEDEKADFSMIKIIDKNLYYLKNNKELKVYDFSTKPSELIFSSENIVDYHFYNNFYYLIQKDASNCFLKIYYKNKTLYKEFSLPLSDTYQILPISGSSAFIYVYDKNFNSIYVINNASRLNSVWATISNVKGFNFINNNTLLYFTDFEIFTFNALTAEKNLLTRLEDKITSAVWHPKEYIIYSTDKSITIFDLKYEKNSINLISLNAVSNLVMDRLGGVLYFSGKIGNQEGIFKLLIK